MQENAAQENARERAWRSSPKGLLTDPPQAGEVRTVQNDVPANPCILRHHRTFALVLDKVQSNEGLPGAQSAAVARPAADLSQPCAPPVGLSLATRSPGVVSQPCGAKYPRFCADSKGV